MTINHSQGQTLAQDGLYLPTHCFSYGQLYVARSRVKSRHTGHCILLSVVGKLQQSIEGCAGVYTKNIVQAELVIGVMMMLSAESEQHNCKVTNVVGNHATYQISVRFADSHKLLKTLHLTGRCTRGCVKVIEFAGQY